MPARRKRKTTRKKTAPLRLPKLPLGPTLWTLAVLNLIAGMLWSPLTAVTKVRVVGVPAGDRERVQTLLEDLEAVPAMRVRAVAVESRVLQEPALRTAKYRQNIFGRGLLAVESRRPVARLAGSDSVALSDDGRLFVPFSSTDHLPQLALPETALAPSASIYGSWESLRVADLCQELLRSVPEVDWTVRLDTRGVISLKGPSPGTVVLGSTRELDLKLERLEQVMQSSPGFLAQVKELNLTDPENPAMIPLTEAP